MIDLNYPWLAFIVYQYVQAENLKGLAAQLKLVCQANRLLLDKRTKDLHHLPTAVADVRLKLLNIYLATAIISEGVPKRAECPL